MASNTWNYTIDISYYFDTSNNFSDYERFDGIADILIDSDWYKDYSDLNNRNLETTVHQLYSVAEYYLFNKTMSAIFDIADETGAFIKTY